MDYGDVRIKSSIRGYNLGLIKPHKLIDLKKGYITGRYVHL